MVIYTHRLCVFLLFTLEFETSTNLWDKKGKEKSYAQFNISISYIVVRNYYARLHPDINHKKIGSRTQTETKIALEGENFFVS